MAEQLAASQQLERIASLSNANARGIAFENRRRIVEAFSEPGKPGDSGRSEVQGAYLYGLARLPRLVISTRPSG
jgi:small subunit ribosomal protein S15